MKLYQGKTSGQYTIHLPKAVVEALGWKAGDTLVPAIHNRGTLILAGHNSAYSVTGGADDGASRMPSTGIVGHISTTPGNRKNLGKDKKKRMVYALLDPDTHAVKYVGAAKSIEGRFASHLHDARQDYRNPKNRWLGRRLAKDALPDIAILEDGIQLRDVNSREQYWIDRMTTCGYRLVNWLHNPMLGVYTDDKRIEHIRSCTCRPCQRGIRRRMVEEERRSRLRFGDNPSVSECISGWFTLGEL